MCSKCLGAMDEKNTSFLIALRFVHSGWSTRRECAPTFEHLLAQNPYGIGSQWQRSNSEQAGWRDEHIERPEWPGTTISCKWTMDEERWSDVRVQTAPHVSLADLTGNKWAHALLLPFRHDKHFLIGSRFSDIVSQLSNKWSSINGFFLFCFVLFCFRGRLMRCFKPMPMVANTSDIHLTDSTGTICFLSLRSNTPIRSEPNSDWRSGR